MATIREKPALNDEAVLVACESWIDGGATEENREEIIYT